MQIYARDSHIYPYTPCLHTFTQISIYFYTGCQGPASPQREGGGGLMQYESPSKISPALYVSPNFSSTTKEKEAFLAGRRRGTYVCRGGGGVIGMGGCCVYGVGCVKD